MKNFDKNACPLPTKKLKTLVFMRFRAVYKMLKNTCLLGKVFATYLAERKSVCLSNEAGSYEKKGWQTVKRKFRPNWAEFSR